MSNRRWRRPGARRRPGASPGTAQLVQLKGGLAPPNPGDIHHGGGPGAGEGGAGVGGSALHSESKQARRSGCPGVDSGHGRVHHNRV